MKRNLACVLSALICSAALSSCQEANQDKSSSVVDVSITDHTTTTQMDNSSAMTNPEQFTKRQVELPTTVDTSRAKLMSSFDYREIVQSEERESYWPIAIDHDDIVIQKCTDILSDNGMTYTDNAMLEYYKYNIKTGTVTKLSGNVPRYNVSMATYALVDGTIRSVCESNLGERFHFSVDLRKNHVELIKTAAVKRGPGNPYEESFFKTFAWDEHSYIEKWYELGSKVVNHVVRYDGDDAKEIVTQTGVCEYAFSNQTIYEFARDDSRHMRFVNIMDADGNLESTLYLPEVDAAANAIEMLSIMDFNVLGDYLLVNVRDEDKTEETCFLYHLKNKTLDLLQDCRFLRPAQATDSNMENWYFYLKHRKEGLSCYNLYNLDREGNITMIAENLPAFPSMITDGQNAAFLTNNKLYFVSAQ